MWSVRLVSAIAICAIACGGNRSPSPQTPSKEPPAARAETPLPAPTDPLNLGFEDVDGVLPHGWALGIGEGPTGAGYEVQLDADAHGGAHSLRISGAPVNTGDFAATSRRVDGAAMRGKRVRVRGWIRTTELTGGWAGFWVRSDSPMVIDNMQDRGVSGTTEWSEVSAVIDVPPDATTITFGALLVGTGAAWFDDLELEVADVPPARNIELAGVVVDDADKPVAGARVTIIDGATHAIRTHVATDANGAFRVETTSGRLGLSVHATGHVGAFENARAREDDVRDLRLVLPTKGGVLVRGSVRGLSPVPEGTYLNVARISPDNSDIFAVPVTAKGTFEVRLPEAETFTIRAVGDLMGARSLEANNGIAEGTVALSAKAPAPPEVVTWIQKHGIALDSSEAGHGLADIAPIARIVGKARVVALGEATHGSREFFRLKHRFLEYLVAEQGFTVFAIEANQPECRALNDYVLHGKGDVQKALDGTYFWTWNTEEVLAMIEWMRAWNADPKHKRKVQFTGFDMQVTKVAYANVSAFLTSVGEDADARLASLVTLAKEDNGLRQAAPAARKTVSDAVAVLAKLFDDHAKAWRKKAGGEAFTDARHDVRILQQNVEMTERDAAAGGYSSARDDYMAENAKWLLDRDPKSRMVIWAHNGHVSHVDGAMGQVLRKQLGKDYVVFGFAFHEGSFQARDWTKGQGSAVIEHSVGPAPSWDLTDAFKRAGKPIVVVDLRKVAKGVVADWFAAPHTMRDTGAVFMSEEAMTSVVQLPSLFDALIYVEKTTRARPLPGGIRK